MEVEDAVTGISALVSLNTIPHDAIVRLAPLLLGAPAWAQVQ
jgi:hypothetical protein